MTSLDPSMRVPEDSARPQVYEGSGEGWVLFAGRR